MYLISLQNQWVKEMIWKEKKISDYDNISEDTTVLVPIKGLAPIHTTQTIFWITK